MLITESVLIRNSAEQLFEFLDDLEANFPRLHPDHRLFRWEQGRGVHEGVAFYLEETIGGRVIQQRFAFTRVERTGVVIRYRHVELAATHLVPRLIVPRIAFRIEFVPAGIRLVVEIRIRTRLVANVDELLDVVRRHIREEGENLKRFVEEPPAALKPALVPIEPYLARLREAVERNPGFRLVECGVLYRDRIGVAVGVECEKADGTLPDLKLTFRCSVSPPGKGFRGTLGAMVMWQRPPGQGRRERTVYEARAQEIRYTGAPPIDELLAQLPWLEEAMLAALQRGGPMDRTVKVYLVESEADWGRRVDEEVEFNTREEAERWAREYNASYNSGPIRSEWSMIAMVERLDGYSVLG
jgi:hypothetical protein